jgi:hypothetical protein
VITPEQHRPEVPPRSKQPVLLLAGEAYEFDIVLRFHLSGCNESGGLTMANWPTVGLTVMGHSFEQASEGTYRFHHAGRTPGCTKLD